MKNEIIKYIRNKNHEPVGVLLAQKYNDSVLVGWSKYAANKETINFSKKTALIIARGRIEKYVDRKKAIEYHMKELGKLPDVESVAVQSKEGTIDLPFMVFDKMSKFMDRCERYFKTDDIMIV